MTCILGFHCRFYWHVWPRWGLKLVQHPGNTPIPLQQECTTNAQCRSHFQTAKVPSGVCKIRPAFLLDSATFLAIANASGNVQGGSCVSGRYIIFSKIREFIKNPIQQTYERAYEYSTMKQEPNRTLVRTFVGLYWDMVENVRNTRRLYQESYDPNTNAIG